VDSKKTKQVKIVRPSLANLDSLLKDLSDDQIKSILEDEYFFNDFFLQLEGVEDFCEAFGEILSNYVSRAKQNLKIENDLNDHIETHKNFYKEYKEDRKEYESLKSKEQDIKDKFGEDKVRKTLNDRIHELENDLEDIQFESYITN
jgi:hypothetical protein